MDWSNINTDRDTNGLGPIEYDQTKVPALIRKYAENVRTKTYGQEVREAQARNAELAGLIAGEAVNTSNETKSRQETVETQFNSIQQELTNKDPISAPEIIAARGGEPTLSARLEKDQQEVNAQLAQTNTEISINVGRTLNPERFEGTDGEKIQQAINLSLASNGERYIELKRTYDLTGTTVDINKGTEIRYPLYFIGGGFTKYDEGFMFSGDVTNSSDIYFEHVRFGSNKGKGTSVFDLDMLIRVHTTNCQFIDVDTPWKSTTRWAQSVRSKGDTVTGGVGAAFDVTERALECTFDDLTLEHRQDGFKIGKPVSFRIVNSVLEGLSGTAITVLTDTLGLYIENNYFESNKQDIDLSTMIQGNTIEIAKNVHVAEPKVGQSDTMILWGDRVSTVSSELNRWHSGRIHDASLITNGKVNSYGDYSGIDDIGIDNINYHDVVKHEEMDGTVKSWLGQFKRYTKTMECTVGADERKYFATSFPDRVYTDDIISIQVFDSLVSLYNYKVNKNSGNLEFFLKNDYVGQRTVEVVITVLRMPYSVIG